jgi:sec-independent protein translocase protein TatC
LNQPDLKLSLMEHLTELRARLGKVVIGVLALGLVSLIWAREIFAFLMKPVLAALPEEGRALIYTSGIEEINVLLKVGLYAGIFMATPLALYQLWLFVGPGLLKSERKLVGPFVAFGTAFFLGGALFCYFVILPSMFKFLLTPGESGAVRERLVLARSRGEDATRFFFVGDAGRASELARAAEAALSTSGDGKIAAPPVMTRSDVELKDRVARMGHLLDLAIARSPQDAARAQVARAIGLHQETEELLAKDQSGLAAVKLEEAATALAQSAPETASAFDALWAAHRHLAAASGKLGEEEWTRPMLSMKEQLSLVLMLEIAFGGIFELPLIMAVLAMVGVLKFSLVGKYQRHALLGCVVAAAIVTPTGDAVNLSMMAVPMIVCFEVGVVFVWIFEKRRKERIAAEEQATTEPS